MLFCGECRWPPATPTTAASRSMRTSSVTGPGALRPRSTVILHFPALSLAKLWEWSKRLIQTSHTRPDNLHDPPLSQITFSPEASNWQPTYFFRTRNPIPNAEPTNQFLMYPPLGGYSAGVLNFQSIATPMPSGSHIASSQWPAGVSTAHYLHHQQHRQLGVHPGKSFSKVIDPIPSFDHFARLHTLPLPLWFSLSADCLVHFPLQNGKPLHISVSM